MPSATPQAFRMLLNYILDSRITLKRPPPVVGQLSPQIAPNTLLN